MATGVSNTSQEFNTFRLCAWGGGNPISNTPDGLTSWKMGMACERAGRLFVFELVKSQKNKGRPKCLGESE